MLLHETLYTEPNLPQKTSRIFEILYGGRGYRRVRLAGVFSEFRSDLYISVVLGESKQYRPFEGLSELSNVLDSREFRCIYFRTSNTGNTIGSFECSYWVSRMYHFTLLLFNPSRAELC